jgi:hypothetical protein
MHVEHSRRHIRHLPAHIQINTSTHTQHMRIPGGVTGISRQRWQSTHKSAVHVHEHILSARPPGPYVTAICCQQRQNSIKCVANTPHWPLNIHQTTKHQAKPHAYYVAASTPNHAAASHLQISTAAYLLCSEGGRYCCCWCCCCCCCWGGAGTNQGSASRTYSRTQTNQQQKVSHKVPTQNMCKTRVPGIYTNSW